MTTSACQFAGQYFLLYILLPTRPWDDFSMATYMLPGELAQNDNEIGDQDKKWRDDFARTFKC